MTGNKSFHALFDLAPDSMFIINSDGFIKEVNQFGYEHLGYTKDEMLGMHVGSFISPEYAPRVKSRLAEVQNLGYLLYESAMLHKDGSLIPIEICLRSIDWDGQNAYCGIVRDISERRRLDNALVESEARFRTLAEDAPEAIVIHDLDSGLFVDATTSAERLFACGHDEILRHSPQDFYAPNQPEGAPSFESIRERGVRIMAGEQMKFERLVRNMKGQEILCEVRLVRLPTANRKLIRASYVDITDRRKVEEALQKSEARFRHALDVLIEGCMILGFDWTYLYINETSARHGLNKPENLIGRTLLEAYPGVETSSVFAHYKRCMEERIPQQFEESYTFANGLTTWYAFSVQPIPEGIFVLSLDISERKKADEALKASLEFSKNLISTMQDGFSVLDKNGCTLDANPALCRMTGFSRDELIGLSAPFPYWPAEQYENIEAAFQKTLQGEVNSYELTFMRKSGERFPVMVSPATVRDRDGGIISYTATVKDITERKQMEVTLRESETRYRTIVERSPIGVSLGRNGVIIDVNPVCLQMFGCNNIEEMRGQPIINFFAPQSRAEVEYRMKQRIEGHSIETPFETIGLRKDGSQFPMYVSPKDVLLDEGPLTYGFLIDFTERKQAEADLRIAATAFESQESLMITDPKGVILRVNKAFTETTGYSTEELLGQTPRLLKSGRHDAEFYREMWETLHHTGTWQGEIWDRRKNGEIYPKWLSISAVKGSDGAVTHYVGSHIDITERKAAEEKIQHLAFYDPLSSLPNRRLLMDRLKQALVSSARNGREGALLFIDLDHFKNLNDTLGHDIGDLLLQQIAQRLESCVREGDTVARLGGDEFLVMLLDLSEQPIEAAAQTEAIGEKILTAITQPFQLDRSLYRCTASIGVTLFNGKQDVTDELMKQADIAMYQAKKAGRNALRFFDQQMQENIFARVSLEGELQNALEFRQFHLYYQLQVDNSGRPLGAEALIRWKHPARGLVSPDQFIPLAEETGLILPIGLWVLETACAQLKLWEQDERTSNLTLAVNVSARQLHQADFVAQVRAIVQNHSINPKLLKLELTESLLLEDIEDTIATMNALNDTGMKFSLDDFGTGYSSLQYLKRLPLDQLKIDKSFVSEIARDSSNITIVRTIVAMARSLNLTVIAEGVEQEQQRRLLAINGCNHYQGYLFGRPEPVEQFEALLNKI